MKKVQSRLLWIEVLQNVIPLDALETHSANHLYKIKKKLYQIPKAYRANDLSPRQYLL